MALLGLDAKLFRLPNGTARTPWPSSGASAGLLEVKNVRDLTLPIQVGDADVTTRGNQGWKASLSTLKDATIDFDMVYDDADADITAISNAFFGVGTNRIIAMAVLSGATSTTGVTGLWADFNVAKFEKKEQLTEAQMVSVSLRPTLTSVPPAWIKIA